MTPKDRKSTFDIQVEFARPGDEQQISDLIFGLAEYEGGVDQCHATPDLIREHLFGQNPSAEALVARKEGETVGVAIFFRTFPTWPCRPCMHLEDLFVPPEHRRQGIGSALLQRLGAICLERGYQRLEWTCLTWNELAKTQYRKIGARELDEWRIWRMDGEALKALGEKGKKCQKDEKAPALSLTGETVHIYTDGGCRPNPGVGGWASILSTGERVKELSGGEDHTTNNRMELLAAINALEALKKPCRIEFHTDSMYLRNGITKWIKTWKKKNWKRGDEPVKNVDLWMRLDDAIQRHEIVWNWVRGHSGDEMNERADLLCQEEIDRRRAG